MRRERDRLVSPRAVARTNDAFLIAIYATTTNDSYVPRKDAKHFYSNSLRRLARSRSPNPQTPESIAVVESGTDAPQIAINASDASYAAHLYSNCIDVRARRLARPADARVCLRGAHLKQYLRHPNAPTPPNRAAVDDEQRVYRLQNE